MAGRATAGRSTTKHDDDSGEATGDATGRDLPSWVLPTLVGVIVTVGIVLRFLPRTALWLDEALSVNIASLPIGDIPDALHRDGHPPLYYVLLHFWIRLFGDSDWTVRALSGLISVLTMPFVYVAGTRLARRANSNVDHPGRVGALSVALFAIMPFAIRYASEARMYVLVMALTTVGYLLIDDALRDPTERTTDPAARRRVLMIVAMAAVTAAMLWTHYWTIWLLGATGLLTLTTMWLRRGAEDRCKAWAGPIDVLIAMVIGGVSFVPWLPTMSFQAAHTGTPWGARFGPFSATIVTIMEYSGGRFGAAHFLSYILFAFILGAAVITITRPDGLRVVGSRITPRIRPELAIIAVALGLGVTMARLSGNTYSGRYAAIVFPLFILTIAAGMALLRTMRATVIAIVVVTAMCTYGAVGSVRANRTQVGELVDLMEEDLAVHGGSGDAVVVVCPDQLGVATQRQIDQRPSLRALVGEVMAFPAAGDPRFIDWVDYGERNTAATTQDFVERLEDSIDADTTVYLMSNDHYLTFETKCEGLRADLSIDRQMTVLERLDTTGLDEAGELRVFRPRS